MKILILQLARLGDCFQTWPALRALQRQYPEAELHVLTRERYMAACEGLEVVKKKIILPSVEWIEPLLGADFNVKSSHEKVGQFIDNLKAENYDWILNYSFSPLSSFLTHALTAVSTQVSGYTRTSDGFLAIPDDMSAYFYAQVGVNKPNRFHLAEIFATMAGLDLHVEDWRGPQGLVPRQGAPSVLIHVGASETKKQISPIKWATIINQLQKIESVRIGLIGSPAESELAEIIMSSVGGEKVENFVGKTNLNELFELIAGTSLVVGADSAPMHMASLTRTPCLNFSLASVNFWETGPRADGSVVLRANDEADLASDRVAQVIKKALNREKQDLSVVVVQSGTPSYWVLEPKNTDFQWRLIQAIYQGGDFPASENPMFYDGISKLSEINSLMIEQMTSLKNGGDLVKLAPLMDRGEEIIQTIGNLVPDISPLIRWYQTEKIRIGPDSPENLLNRSLGIQELLQKVLALYIEENEASTSASP
jgi:heptosyltransferase III